MTSKYTSFAVAGTGGVGSRIITALAAKPGVKLAILSRSASTSVPSNTTLKVVDYSSRDSLKSALEGVQVVISTLNGAGILAQEALADAAKAAGVKVAKHLKQIGLPALQVFTLFIGFPGFDYGFNLKGEKASWIGEGDNPITFTARADVAAFLAHALSTFALSDLQDKTFRLEGDRKSFNQIVETYEKTHPGKKVVVTRTPVEQAKQTLATQEGMPAFVTYLFLTWAEGPAVYQTGPLSNSLWSEWRPASIESILAGYD
ncbi:hypothetical protein RQP46_008750 [Phenoliferia psychrophenolica]